ncbi:rho GTPase-activating protein gacF-like isoform X2 [Teleopsis dalmanni]|uniref:rho GTPase-activating protein gacF-like isoform X2 n=1 Tax=Teleopsis dalmanni TaxID=139649 RepID=UPI0018CDE4FD|nr:rho GTPase-activating protein gacF-like isoform X2 [Teleopsis dalmanni]
MHHHTTTTTGGVNGAPGVVSNVAYQHHMNLNHHHILNHHSPYSNNYPLHHSSSHHIHSDQTKSLQELQHEVGALLEFRDLVIETFPDLKHKMASMSSSASTAVAGSTTPSVSATNTLTGVMSNSSLASRREWEPGIRVKRKLAQKEPSSSTSTAAVAVSTNGAVVAGELSSSSLTRSRSNSHSGKKEPKSGENNNGSVVQDSGFSTETSSSKEGHSASSTNGAMTGPIASNRLLCLESDDELLNLLDVIHRKSNRLREEVEHLQNYERNNLRGGVSNNGEDNCANALTKSNSGSSAISGLTPKTFRDHVERLNKEDIKQLRKERDRLLDKLAEMEAETLTGRIKATKMNDQMTELITVKKDLEEQLKLAMAQKLELSSRVQQLQLQQQQQQSKSSSSQSDYSSQRNFLSSATTVLSTGSGASHNENLAAAAATTVPLQQNRRLNTFQPVVVEQQQQKSDNYLAFHRSAGSDSKESPVAVTANTLGRLDGIVSTPSAKNTKCRVTDSKRFAAILMENSVVELQRHLLTLTVQNQVLMQKLDQATKSKTHIAKRLDKSKEDVEDLRFQLEEKNIELEGTKAQLRVLESRMHSSTPNSGATTNSYMHSQNDYETNRSSASTTLMISRRAGYGIDLNSSDMRSGTPISQNGHMPQPTATQISTPSMKAMVHLALDDIQQHSSSTESAHDHELQQDSPQTINSKLMSTSVGGVSPFEQHYSARGYQAVKKFTTAASKPSKIPLPGSKSGSYFAGKPPTGRPSTAGRSPPSANISASSNASSKSSLSRSTGNLLYSKSPNSLKRADSAQSVRKDNSSSFSNNTSRSSTSSSIPMSTTPYSASKSYGAAVTSPSPRVLQNSPLPKLKRESLTSRVRHLDSLSRIHQQTNNSNNNSSASDNSHMSPTTPLTRSPITPHNNDNASSYLVSSTPKPSAIAAHLNATLRKDLQLSSNSFSHGSSAQQQFQRRTTNATTPTATTTTTGAAVTTTRRFSSASVMGARITAARNQQEHNNAIGENGNERNSNSPTVNGTNINSDSDSGKTSKCM